jgi:hypothetical protein
MASAAINLSGRLIRRGECDYFKLEGVNFSTLKTLVRSPKHYRHRLREPFAQTPAMLLGSAAHTAILEPDRFMLDYAMFTGARRAGKAWDEFSAINADKTILKSEEFMAAIAMRDAVRSHPIAREYVAAGEPEIALQWTDSETGMACKGRLDWLNTEDGPVLVNLKTCRDVTPFAFQRQAASMCYHVQDAFYAGGYETITGTVPRVVIVSVENTAPHDVVVYRVPPEVLEIGADEYRRWLRMLQECQRSKRWPGISEEAELEFSLPAWLVPDETNLSDLGLTGWKE